MSDHKHEEAFSTADTSDVGDASAETDHMLNQATSATVNVPATYDEAAIAPSTAESPTAESAESSQKKKKKANKATQTSTAAVQGSLAGGTWVALIAGAFLLIILLVFILQNQQPVELILLSWKFTVPSGVGFLLAAIAGALIMALVGGVRMIQLRRQIKKRSRETAG